jgi:hypothetical protein
MGQVVDDGGAPPPDHLRTMQSQTDNKEEPWL